MITPALRGQAKIAEDVGLEIDGQDGLAEAWVEGEEPVSETLLVMRRSRGHGNDGDSEAAELEALHG